MEESIDEPFERSERELEALIDDPIDELFERKSQEVSGDLIKELLCRKMSDWKLEEMLEGKIEDASEMAFEMASEMTFDPHLLGEFFRRKSAGVGGGGGVGGGVGTAAASPSPSSCSPPINAEAEDALKTPLERCISPVE